MSSSGSSLAALGPFAENDTVNVVIDTPKGSRNKF